MPYYERHLPHWNPEDAGLFITWRLHGTLPREINFVAATAGRAFVAIDRQLDRAAVGPRWLERPEVAVRVAQSLQHGAATLHLYDLRAWVIMCNHVHILIDPRADMARITKSIKNYSARQANAVLERSGPFWQTESYDRWVRSGEAKERIVRYIESNPVWAGLVDRPEDWRWSSAWAGQEAYPTKTTEQPCER
ncbi:MAG TPA: transposase [Candidatus Acidoferrales bacterium]|nr:transposase [Candidatus Acidoferrales bacterium]